MAQRNAGSSRKPAKILPMRRLVSASMAFALGLSIVTSSTLPRRSVLIGSLISFSHPDQGIDGHRPLPLGHDKQRIHIQFLERIGMDFSKARHGRYSVHDCGAVAGAAAKTPKKTPYAQPLQAPLDLAAARRQEQCHRI